MSGPGLVSEMTAITEFPVTMPEGPHPFPSRTRKLSPPGPMILQPRGCGKVGRCRVLLKPTGVNPWAFLLAFVWKERHRDYAAHCTDEKEWSSDTQVCYSWRTDH